MSYDPEVLSPAPAPSGSAANNTLEAGDKTKEVYSGETLLVSAYAIIWVILMVWIFALWRRQAGLHARLDDLEKVIDKAAASQPKK